VCVIGAVFENEHANIIIFIKICTLLLEPHQGMVFAGYHSQTITAYGSSVAIIHY
jgi:hypothetical protein